MISLTSLGSGRVKFRCSGKLPMSIALSDLFANFARSQSTGSKLDSRCNLKLPAIMCLGTLVGFNKYYGTFSATRSSSLLPAARLSGSVQLTASTKTDRDLREDWDGRKSGRQEAAGA